MAARGGADDPCPLLHEAALTWLKAEATPRLIVDDELQVQWINDLAATLLAERRGLELRADCLASTDAALQDELRSLLQSAVDGEASICLQQPCGAGWLLVRAWRLAGRPTPLYGFTLIVAGGKPSARYRHLDTAFGLTPSEHRVLLDMLLGNDAETLASLHGVTIETTRSHIRRIYSKLAVTSRERLFAKVQPFNLRS